MKSWSATLALGGGGARGIAHLGAIEELLTAGLAVERIVGVSIGSLVGAVYAFDPDIARVQTKTSAFLSSPEFVRHQKYLLGAHPAPAEKASGRMLNGYHRFAKYVRANRMFHRAVSRSSLIPGVLLEEVVNQLLPDADIADAKIPLSVVTVDLNTGEPVVFEKGPVRLAVRASASVPGVFPPVPFEERLLCDLGGFCSLPLGVARSYEPEIVVAVDVGSSLKPLSDVPTALDVLMRMSDIGAAIFRKHLGAQADLLIVPDVDDVAWFDFTTADALVEAGRAAARNSLARFTPARRTWIERFFSGTPRSA